MGNAKPTHKSARDLGLTPHEERLLQSYFRSRTRPYLVAIAVLLCAIGAIFSIGMPGAADPADAAEEIAAEVERATAELRGEFETELSALRAEVETASAAVKKSASDRDGATDATARKRIQDFEGALRRVKQRIDELEKGAESTQAKLLGLEDRRLVEAALTDSPGVEPPAEASDARDAR